jgi:hypothetical protein
MEYTRKPWTITKMAAAMPRSRLKSVSISVPWVELARFNKGL